MKQEYVILVDENDSETGFMDKLEAHRKAALHRAFSVFVFNKQNELLLQQRAFTKYHSPGLWTNTCCSHPRPGENVEAAAHRRLTEEMGFTCDLDKVMHFIYCEPVGNNLTEHEFDHVFLGFCDIAPVVNPEEVHDYRWISLDELKNEIINEPEKFTVWLKIAFQPIYNLMANRIHVKQ